jgi:hypothetical protein
VVASSTFFDSSRHDRAQVWSVSGTADAQYKLTLKHQLGAGAGYSYQDFGDRQDIPGSQTSTYRVFGSWRWTITETLSLDLTAVRPISRPTGRRDRVRRVRSRSRVAARVRRVRRQEALHRRRSARSLLRASIRCGSSTATGRSCAGNDHRLAPTRDRDG